MKCDVGPERIILTDGLQPYVFRTGQGALFCQAQLSFPPGYRPPAENAFPGLPGNVISRDGGRSWQRWAYPPPQDESEALKTGRGSYWDQVTTTAQLGPTIEGAAAALRDGTVLMLDWVGRGPDEQGWFEGRLWESGDDLATLAGPVPWRVHLPQAKAGRDDGGHPFRAVCIHRTLLELPEGELLATAYGWFHGDETPVGYRPEMWKTRSFLLRSGDRGRSWRFVSTIAVDPTVGEEGFNEPALVRVSRGPRAGRLVCHLRTGSNDYPIYQATSDDGGATWTPARSLGIHGVDPDLIETSDGRLVGVVGRRNWKDENRHLRRYQVIVSEDAGESWQVAASWGVEPYAGTQAMTSYAGLCQVEPGRVLVVYDIGAWGQPVRYVAGRELTLR